MTTTCNCLVSRTTYASNAQRAHATHQTGCAALVKLPGYSDHAYDIETMKGGVKFMVRVEGRSRAVAASKVRKMGFEVMSVNMIG